MALGAQGLLRSCGHRYLPAIHHNIRVVETVVLENGLFVPCQRQVVSTKIGEILIVHSTHRNKGLYSSNPEIDENDENGGCHPGKIRGFAKGWFPKGWFWRMFPRNEKTGTRVHSPKPPFWKPSFYLPMTLFGVDKRVVSKRVVSADVPPERKPERGHVRQNHPFRKPPFYLPVKNGWGVAKGSSVSWVAKFKGDKNSEGKLSNGWSRSSKVIKLLLSAGK